MEEKECTLLVAMGKGTPLTSSQIKDLLESDDDLMKIGAMKEAIKFQLNGQTLPELFTTILKYAFPSDNCTIQKLLLLYLENLDITELSAEKESISKYLSKWLEEPNEYMCGVTLRFLCRLNEIDMIEPLIPSIRSLLKSRQSYVRRSAILAVKAIYKHPQGKQLLADATEMSEKVLSSEQDQSAKRNGFLMLCDCDQDLAVNIMDWNVSKAPDWGEPFQLVVLDFIKELCTPLKKKGKTKEVYEKCLGIIRELMRAPSTAVVYESTRILIYLAPEPSAINSAVNTYCQLLSQIDNNVKLIVLDRLKELKSSHKDIMFDHPNIAGVITPKTMSFPDFLDMWNASNYVEEKFEFFTNSEDKQAFLDQIIKYMNMLEVRRSSYGDYLIGCLCGSLFREDIIAQVVIKTVASGILNVYIYIRAQSISRSLIERILVSNHHAICPVKPP